MSGSHSWNLSARTLSRNFNGRWLACLCVLLGVSVSAAAVADDQFQMPQVKEPAIPARVVNLADVGGRPDGKTLNTEIIARAVSSLAEKGGGKLVVPAGIWRTGPIRLQSNLELHLEEGALVQFTSDFKQYPEVTFDVRGEKETRLMSPLYGENLQNVAITGRGVFDGAGDAWRPVKKIKMTARQWKQLLASGGVLEDNGNIWWPSEEARKDRRPVLLKLVNCRQILLQGVTFQNSPMWNLNPTLCADVTIRDVTVRNPWYSQNGDGLDLEHCRKVVVRNSRFDVGDDAICLKSGANEKGHRIGVPTENVLVEDCIVYHGHGGFTIGSEMSGGVRNIRVNNCLFMGTDVGLRFKSQRGRGGIVEKIYISNVRMTDIATDAIGFNMYYSGQAPLDENGDLTTGESKAVPVSEETPQFRDIYFDDIVCRGARSAVVLEGLPEMPIRGVHLHNVSITAERGLACMDAENITCENVEILNSKGPVVNLFDTKNAVLDHLIFPKGAEAVIKAQGDKNGGIVIQNTDLKSAAKDFILTGGATTNAFQIK
ncbi:MAG TPA: glycoside hydrolase family 28 protein [Verrucomicrobiae bacterium]|nr:glycoside hydrolase family 28 protein [Verrucomicrobiae bacterium]